MAFNFTWGGAHRHESFEKAFTFLKKKSIKPKAVVVHDSNRPFLSDEFLNRVNQQIKLISHERPCAIPILNCIDSMVTDIEGSLSYFPREKIYQVQTPQIIHWDSLLTAFERKKSIRVWSDEGSFMYNMGFDIFSYQGDLLNKKVTYPTDI